MPTQLIAKLLEVAYSETRSDISEHEIEARLLDNLLGKSLDFTTENGTKGEIEFHSIGRGKDQPSTVITLQVRGIEFEQEAERLTLDFRYIFYREFGHDFLFRGSPTNFLVTSPFVQKLGPENIMIEFVMYGNTVHQINRCLATFAEVVRSHHGDLHRTAIEWYEDKDSEWEADPEINLKEPVRKSVSWDDPIERIYETSNDESYIQGYINYIENPEGEVRETIDSRNTYAESSS